MENFFQYELIGEQLNWSITITNLKMARYSAEIYDPNHKVIEEWKKQFTTDEIPDNFDITKDLKDLKDSRFSFIVYAMDPTNNGGNYDCIITFSQNSKVIYVYTASGTIEKGRGKVDIMAEAILLKAK